MAQVRYEGGLINGQIKFAPAISRDEVINFAKEVKEGEEAAKYKFIAVRGCGTDQFGIAFTYEYDGTKKTCEKLMYKMTDKLLRRFGHQVSWDISGGLWIIE